MKKIILSALILSTSLLISCNKDEEPSPQTSNTPVATSRTLNLDDNPNVSECELTLQLFQEFIIDANLTDLERKEQEDIQNSLRQNYLDCLELNGDIAQ